MGINELFDGIAKVVEQLAEELAEPGLQVKISRTGRDQKVGSEKTGNNGVKEKEISRISRKPDNREVSRRRQETP